MSQTLRIIYSVYGHDGEDDPYGKWIRNYTDYPPDDELLKLSIQWDVLIQVKKFYCEAI